MTSASVNWARVSVCRSWCRLASVTGSSSRGGRTSQPSLSAGPSVFGRGAQVGDVVGRGALDRSHRLPVVAELAVVVVLDHHTAAGTRPVHECATAPRWQGRAGRVLVGRGHFHGGGRSGYFGPCSVLVHRERHHGPTVVADHVTVERHAGIFPSHPRVA